MHCNHPLLASSSLSRKFPQQMFPVIPWNPLNFPIISPISPPQMPLKPVRLPGSGMRIPHNFRIFPIMGYLPPTLTWWLFLVKSMHVNFCELFKNKLPHLSNYIFLFVDRLLQVNKFELSTLQLNSLYFWWSIFKPLNGIQYKQPEGIKVTRRANPNPHLSSTSCVKHLLHHPPCHPLGHSTKPMFRSRWFGHGSSTTSSSSVCGVWNIQMRNSSRTQPRLRVLIVNKLRVSVLAHHSTSCWGYSCITALALFHCRCVLKRALFIDKHKLIPKFM